MNTFIPIAIQERHRVIIKIKIPKIKLKNNTVKYNRDCFNNQQRSYIVVTV